MIRFLILSVLAFTHSLVAALEADDLIGFWKMDDQAVVIEIIQTTKGYEGVVHQAEQAPKAKGKRMLKGLRFDPANGVWQGTMIAIKKNKELDTEISMPSPDRFSAKASLGWFSTTVNWQRLAPDSGNKVQQQPSTPD